MPSSPLLAKRGTSSRVVNAIVMRYGNNMFEFYKRDCASSWPLTRLYLSWGMAEDAPERGWGPSNRRRRCLCFLARMWCWNWTSFLSIIWQRSQKNVPPLMVMKRGNSGTGSGSSSGSLFGADADAMAFKATDQKILWTKCIDNVVSWNCMPLTRLAPICILFEIAWFIKNSMFRMFSICSKMFTQCDDDRLPINLSIHDLSNLTIRLAVFQSWSFAQVSQAAYLVPFSG